MGFKGSLFIKKKLQELFPSCWRKARPVEPGVQIFIEDIMLRIFRHTFACRTKNDLKRSWPDYVRALPVHFPHAERFILLFDDDVNVPLAKKPTQEERDHDGLTESELTVLGVAASLCDQSLLFAEYERRILTLFGNDPKVVKGERTPFQMFMQKYVKTRGLREDSVKFVAQNLVDIQRWDYPNSVLHIDGGPWVMDDASVGQRCHMEIDSNGFHRVPDDGKRYLRLGEADIKITHFVHMNREKTIWITCSDTDLLAILLLAVKNLIETTTGEVNTRIFLDLSTPKANDNPNNNNNNNNGGNGTSCTASTDRSPSVGEVVDVVELWRQIHRQFVTLYPGLKNPVEILCLLMMLSGSDFVKNLPNLAIASLWRAFDGGGYALLAESVGTSPLEVDSRQHRMSVDEDAILRFVRFAYAIRLSKAKPITLLERQSTTIEEIQARLCRRLDTLDQFRDHYQAKISNSKLKRPPKPLADLQDFHANIRRLVWNMWYWCEGHNLASRKDSVASTPNGISMYGWDAISTEAKGNYSASRAKQVCHFSALQQ